MQAEEQVREMQRKTEKQIFAHSIAKQIHDFANSNCEIDQILKIVENIFICGREKGKSDITEYPTDEWGNKIEIPSEESKGEGGERDEINKLE